MFAEYIAGGLTLVFVCSFVKIDLNFEFRRRNKIWKIT